MKAINGTSTRKSLEETAYLLRSPANAKRLLEAMARLKKGKGKEVAVDLLK